MQIDLNIQCEAIEIDYSRGLGLFIQKVDIEDLFDCIKQDILKRFSIEEIKEWIEEHE